VEGDPMRAMWLGAVVAPLMMAGLAFGAEAKEGGTCAQHGTSIDFHDTPNDAAKAAKKDGKLVLLLHVSGNFEDPRFT
jgi:hypothetical protein